MFPSHSPQQLLMIDIESEVVFPYVYGSLAFSLGKKSETHQTHKWICYVRGVNNQDLSYFIDKVEFRLHTSFEKPIRIVEKPPYEIQENGWGEFEIMIRIYFKHPNMPFVEVPHMLKLHHSHATGGQAAKKPLCSEVYDEVVFVQSDEHIEKMLAVKESAPVMEPSQMDIQASDEVETLASPDQPLKSIVNYTKFFSEIKAADHFSRLDDATKFIQYEIRILEERMRVVDADLQKVYNDIYDKLPMGM